MAIHPLWTDDYWLLIMQLYQKSPAGVKSEYSRSVVELALELHIPPKTLQEQMEAALPLSVPLPTSGWLRPRGCGRTQLGSPLRACRDRLLPVRGHHVWCPYVRGKRLSAPLLHEERGHHV